MRLALRISRLFQADGGFLAQLGIHVFVHSWEAQAKSFPVKVDLHPPIIVPRYGHGNFYKSVPGLSFLGIRIRLPVFVVVIISVWTDASAAQILYDVVQ